MEQASTLEQEGDAAADYLEGLLDIADLDGDIDIAAEGNRALVSIVEVDGADLAHLVGEDGEILDALQELTRLAAARETGERSRLMLDIAGHRAAQRERLREAAAKAVAEAQRTAAPVRMVPMNPFERKVVHDAVAEAGLLSESDGEEPERCVVIRLP
jgi:spoIIIJ-associated protein